MSKRNVMHIYCRTASRDVPKLCGEATEEKSRFAVLKIMSGSLSAKTVGDKVLLDLELPKECLYKGILTLRHKVEHEFNEWKV